ncbi:MAG TPA: hypothetical protein VMA71_09325 [Alloacidobacterium sp.]|nr:hypothetical protein [Alloacidobacterium sp.]
MSYFKPGGSVVASNRDDGPQWCVFSVDESGQLNVAWSGELPLTPPLPWLGPIKIGPENLTIPGAQLAVSRQFGTDQIAVFLFDNKGQLNAIKSGAPLGWNDPITIGKTDVAPAGASLAACGQSTGNRTNVFWVDTNGQLNVTYVDGNGQWSEAEALGSSGLASPGAPVAAIQQSGTDLTSVFVVDKGGQLNGFSQAGTGNWNGPQKIGPSNLATSGAAIATQALFDGVRTGVFLFDKNGQLNAFTDLNGSGNWQGPVTQGPSGFADPGAWLTAIQQLPLLQVDILAVDKNGKLNVFVSDSNANLSGPNAIGGSASLVAGCPVAAMQQPPSLLTDLALIDKNGNINVFWVQENDPWKGPIVLAEPVPEPSGGYRGSANYVFLSGSSCAKLTNIQATIYVTEDLVWKSSEDQKNSKFEKGFSIQLNAEPDNTQSLDWFQFLTVLSGSELSAWTNIWNPSDIGTDTPLWDPPQMQILLLSELPAGRIPAGYSIVIAIENDAKNGRVVGATWKVYNAASQQVGFFLQPLNSSTSDISTVSSFQVTFGGADNGSHATFSSGAGLIVVQADQAISASGSYPKCIAYTGGTAETSNIAYGSVTSTPGTMLAQAFSVAPATASVKLANPGARSSPPRPAR